MNIAGHDGNPVAGVIAHLVAEGDRPLVPMNIDVLSDEAMSFLAARRGMDDEPSELIALLLAAGRLSPLLRDGLEALAGTFDADEIRFMLDVFLHDFHSLASAGNLATGLADHYGWEAFRDVPEQHRALMAKLVALSRLDSFALADCLERIWHVEMRKRGAGDVVDWAGAAGLKLAA